MILTYKYRIKDRSAKKTLNRYAFAVNQVWNYCNEVQRKTEDIYKSGVPERKWPSNWDLRNLTKGASKELGISSITIQMVCEQYARSRDKTKHSLKFRSSGGSRKSLGWVPFWPTTVKVEGNSIIHLKKKFRWFGNERRPLPINIGSGAFVEDASGRWYVVFHVAIEDLPTGNGEVGIDLGLTTLATSSDGEKIPALRHYKRWEQKLKTAQRARRKNRVRAIHAKIKNARRDQLHKASCEIARQNRLIVVGNVSSSNLAKTRFAKSVLDAGWSSFREMLRYKASRHGATYLEVDESFTTQRCSSCQEIPDSSPKGRGALGMREWVCSDCGVSHDRDVNAARNILALGLSAQPPAGGSR